MSPSTLDLFLFTFNCAKNLINVAVFASHLQAALSQNATGLPDLVVFSLQEVAPLSYSFIGSYFLSPYYSRYEEALNLAAVKVLAASEAQSGGHGDGASAAMHGPQPYTLVRTRNVGMTAIMLFARTPAALLQIEEAECGFGAADMGNKGAVGLRVVWSDGKPAADGDEEASPRTTELTFVATHLAAMEWNLKKRNANWRSIVSGLTFENPKTAIPGVFPVNTSLPNSDDDGTVPLEDSDSSPDVPADSEDSDTRPLLDRRRSSGFHPDHPDLTAAHHATLHDMSVFKPTSHLFLSGDLNYRISTSAPPAGAPFPSFDADSPHHWATFLRRDQLTQERTAGRTLTGLSEAEVAFGPSYKYDVLDDAAGAENEVAAREEGEVPWKWAPHRWPSWCDRILYLDVPSWTRRRLRQKAAGAGAAAGSKDGADAQRGEVVVKAYDSMPVVVTSDHRPVFLRVQVPVLGPKEMAPPMPLAEEELEDESGVLVETLLEEDLADPRVSLPVPIDVHAWERRAAARRREIVVGWSMFLWSTREGAAVIATTLAVGVGCWWAWRLW